MSDEALNRTALMDLVATLERRVSALESDVDTLKRSRLTIVGKPDPIEPIAQAIVAYARTRRRVSTTSHELRAACGFGDDVHGMTIDGAQWSRIASGAFVGVTAEADGETLIPKAGTFSLWRLAAEPKPAT
jgi:hypothetical protein